MPASPRLHCHPLHAAALASTLLLTSCGGGGGGGSTAPAPSAATATRPVTQSDLEIAQALYSGAPRTPAGFQQDAPVAGHDYVSTLHLKNTDLDATLVPPYPQYELCTDDWNQALDWSEVSASAAAQYSTLVATDDDARYFEFSRVRDGDPQFYARTRIFKCSYVDRSTADLRSPEGSAGTLNGRPLGAQELRMLVEYLWQFTRYNNFGHAVLKSSGASSAGGLSHTLVIASLARGGLSPACDRVDVIAWKHTADLNSGSLNLEVAPLLSFGARELGGQAELCSS